MLGQTVAQLCFDFFSRLSIIVEPKEVSVSSDTGILPIRQFDDQFGFTDRFIACLNDPRDPDLTRHAFAEMVRQRIYGIHAGYEDCNDHGSLRGDPVFKIVAGRKPQDDDLEHVVNRLRQAWPDVGIHIRGDSSFGMPWMFEVCERLQLTYTFGLAANAVLKRATEGLLQRAVEQFEQTGENARLFDQMVYRAGTWKNPRRVIAKAECNRVGTNRRSDHHPRLMAAPLLVSSRLPTNRVIPR